MLESVLMKLLFICAMKPKKKKLINVDKPRTMRKQESAFIISLRF